MKGINFKKLFKVEGKGALSIDIGSQSVKFVYMEKDKVLAYGLKEFLEIPDISGIIRELIKDLKPAKVYSFVSGPSVSLRQAPFPKMSKKELKDAILLRLDKYSPFTIDEAILDYKTLGTVTEAGKEVNNVMVVSVRKDIIADHIATLRKVGLEPTAISVVPFALAAAIKKFGDLKEEEVVLLLDIGAEFTDMVFIRNKQLEFARTVTTAGNSLTEAMTVAIATEEGELALSLEEAEKYKRTYGIPDETSEEVLPNGIKVKRLLNLQRPALERFLGEINRSIDYYKREYNVPAINRILICGGGAELKGLKEYLEENLKIKVELFDPFKTHNLYLPGFPQNIGHRLVAALGLHFDPEAVDLLPAELKIKRYSAKDLQIVGAIAILLIPLLILINIGMEVQKALEYNQIKNLKKELKEVEVYSEEYTTLKNKVDELEAQQKLLKSIVGETEVVTPLLRFFSKEVPSNIQLNTLTFTGLSKINLKGIVTGKPEYLEIDLADFMLKLENSKVVKNVQLINKTKSYLVSGEEVLNFELECLLE